MIYRHQLTLGGLQVKLGGSRLSVAPWKSADNDGGDNAKAWFTSRITNGYFNGYDARRVGQEASTNNIGSGRATTYMETGYADVAVEGVFENSIGLSGLPCVRVTPETWEHNLSAAPEIWFNPTTGSGLWAVWNVAVPSVRQSLPVFGPYQILLPGTPRYVRMEVIGRRLRCFDENNAFTMEMVVPPTMEHSTKHGVTHDVTMQYRPDGAGGWEEMPNFGETEGMAESSWSYTPITHFSDEEPGVLGAELLRNIDFETNTDWTTSGGWIIDTTTDDDLLVRPAAVVYYAPAGSPFVSGYFRQTLTAPLVAGRRYRFTYSLITVDMLQATLNKGIGSLTAEIYDGSATTGAIASLTGTGSKTVEFVATGAHTTLSIVAQSAADSGTNKLHLKLNYASLREFTPEDDG